MSPRPREDHALLILGLAVVLVCSPFTDWWTSFALPWWAMFVPWALVVALIAGNARS